MSIYQCDKCGCAENTALGWYHCRNKSERMLGAEFKDGTKLCSSCSPSMFADGSNFSKGGGWHNQFTRTFLPKGVCFTNMDGNLECKNSGLIGTALYDNYGRDAEYESLTDNW